MEKRTILILTTLSCLFLFFVGPLALWLTIKEDFSDGEKNFLLNLLNFEATLFLAGIVLIAINIIPILGLIISGLGGALLWIINIIVILVATIKVIKNEEYKFPFAIDLIKK